MRRVLVGILGLALGLGIAGAAFALAPALDPRWRTATARDPRISYSCHPSNVGGGANFLFGMRSVDTPYFSFLSDDDVLLPHFFETALVGFETRPSALYNERTPETALIPSRGYARYF